jgi:hypothetical protein
MATLPTNHKLKPIFLKMSKYWDSFLVLQKYSRPETLHNLSTSKVDQEEYRKIFNHIIERIDHEGERSTVKYIKRVRTYLYKWLARDKPEAHFMKIHRQTGLPSLLGEKVGRAIASGDRDCYRNVLTILQVSYIITDNKLIPEISTITDSPQISTLALSELEDFTTNYAIKILNPKYELPDWSDPHESTSAGPLGPAVWTAPLELSLLTPEMLQCIRDLGGSKLSEYLDSCYNNRELHQELSHFIAKRRGNPHQGTRTSLRRLVAIPAPECKTRIIAILDWWTQTSLRVVHEWSFDILRDLRCDLTFNQDGFKTVLPKTGPYFSFDLSAATDRFPMVYQEFVMKLLIGEKRSRAWASLLTLNEYTADWDRQKYTYKAGQPMGAYSSWSVFTLCHHLVVRFSAFKAGFDPVKFSDYVILGDDIVIANSLAAEQYEKIIRSLGVGISREKSLVSIDSFEIAKRYYNEGKELTPFPLASIIENRSSVAALWSTTLVARERGFTFLDESSTPRFVAEIQRSSGRVVRSTLRIARDLQALHTITRVGPDDDRFIAAFTAITRSLRLQVPCTTKPELLAEWLYIVVGGLVVRYQGQLLDRTSDQYLSLKRLILQDFMEYLEEKQDQAPDLKLDSTSLLRDFVLTRLTGLATIGMMREQNNLRSILSEGPTRQFLTLAVTPVGDLSRTISRMVNLKQSAQRAAFLQFLRTEAIRYEHQRWRALNE